MAASLIERLPTGLRSAALRKLSANANAPGAGVKQSGRGQNALRKRAGELGIFLIESSYVSPTVANIGGVNPPGVATVTLDAAGGTPLTTDITTSELDSCDFLEAGTKTISVSVPTDLKGEALVVV